MLKNSSSICATKFRLLAIILFCLPCFANAAETNNLHLNEFQGGVTLATQGGGSSFGVIAKYLPSYDLITGANPISVGLDLGITSFNNSGQSNFYVLQYGISGKYLMNSNFDASLALGGQTWTSGNGTAFYVGPTLNYHLTERLLYVLDGFYVSYNAVTQTHFANLVSAGINFKF